MALERVKKAKFAHIGMVKKIKTTKQEKRIERDIIKVVLFFVVIIGVYFAASAYFKSLNYIDYKGLTFSKERIGTNLTVFHHSYYFKAPDGRLINYNMYLRNEPQELVKLVPLTGDKITFDAKKPVYIAINSKGLNECTFGNLAMATLTSYIVDNQMKVIRGNLDFWDAGTNHDEWVTCNEKQTNKVIEIFAGNETKITSNGNCYQISVANCDILPAVERLELQAVLDAKRVAIKK